MEEDLQLPNILVTVDKEWLKARVAFSQKQLIQSTLGLSFV